MENEHNYWNKICERYVYMLLIDNRGKKSRFFGQTKILYADQTISIKKRTIEHFEGRNSKFLKYKFPDARKILVYVEYVYGTEEDACVREIEIKRLKRPQKEKLIMSDRNVLIKYKPMKCIILKKYGAPEEQVAFSLRK